MLDAGERSGTIYDDEDEYPPPYRLDGKKVALVR